MRTDKAYRCALCGELKTKKPGGSRYRCNRHSTATRIRPLGSRTMTPIDRLMADLERETA
jgi:hypothetical protein